MDVGAKSVHIDVVDNIPMGVIEKSPIHGYGLFAQQDLPDNSVLVVLDGQIVAWATYKMKLDMSLDAMNEWNALTADTLLVRSRRTKNSFINLHL